ASVRYLHLDAERMCAYVSACGLAVTQCDFEAKAPPIAVDASAIPAMLKRSETLWGTALPYYLRIAKSADAEVRSLNEAVEQVEGSDEREGFLAIAYQDGGLISVSGVLLPFQAEARNANWWAPYRSALR